MLPLLFTLACLRQEASPSVRDLIERLGSEDIKVREATMGQLKALGAAAVPELTRAAQGNDAEIAARALQILKGWEGDQALTRLDAALQQAGSLRTAYRSELTMTFEGLTVKTAVSGILLIKGEKVRVACRADSRSETRGDFDPRQESIKTLIVCDGPTLRILNRGRTVEKVPPKGFRSNVVTALLLGGLSSPFAAHLTDDGPALSELLKRDGADAENDGKEGTKLTYKVHAAKADPIFDVQLWIDPTTLLPRRRIVTWAGPDYKASLWETYGGFVLNPEIPDGEFRLEAEKK